MVHIKDLLLLIGREAYEVMVGVSSLAIQVVLSRMCCAVFKYDSSVKNKYIINYKSL